MKQSLAVLILSFSISYLLIPLLIKLAYQKGYFDYPNHRSSHDQKVPFLGGMAIMIGLILSLVSFATFYLPALMLILIASIVIAAIGLYDDLFALKAKQKLFLQLIVVSLFLIFSPHSLDLTIIGMKNFLGIELLSFLFSLLFVLLVLNGFNLLDGINGLSAGLALIGTLGLGYLFYSNGFMAYSLLSIATFGGTLAFLKFNSSPAKIFLGDCGSLLLGFLIGSLGLLALTLPIDGSLMQREVNLPLLVLAGLIFPIVDTIKVFFSRILKGKTPFSADKNHIHHVLIKKGWSHEKASIFLSGFTIALIVLTYLISNLLFQLQFLIISSIVVVFYFSLNIWRKPVESVEISNRELTRE